MLSLLLFAACPAESELDAEVPDDTEDTDSDTGDSQSENPEWDTSSNLCGTVERNGAPPGGTAYVVNVKRGHEACQGSDTGESWWGSVVEESKLDGDYFQATVENGTYGVEVDAPDGYTGCSPVEVSSSETCAQAVLIELGYEAQVDKPNVYLYPEVPTAVRVALPAWRKLTLADPVYPVDGWRVVANPDGRLQTQVGSRDYLFYEMSYDAARFQTEQGWCVRGPLAQESIELAMGEMGFLPNEVADFSEAWDPIFPRADWMTVFPQFEVGQLLIDPEPDQLLRAWFHVVPGCQAVTEPELPLVERTGFHAAEWGVSFARSLNREPIVVEGFR